MRTHRLLVAILLLAFGYVPAADAAPPVLKGTTVVTGSAVGSMRVRLPRPVTVSLAPTADWRNGVDATFAGDGRFLALALVRAGSWEEWDETWFTRTGVCMIRGCPAPDPRFIGARWQGLSGEVESTTLPAGVYTLHWLADGEPASVTLRLRGLSGRTTLRPPAVRAAVWGPPATVEAVDPVTSTGVKSYAGDTEVSVPKGGHKIHTQWVRTDSSIDAKVSVCTTPPEGSRAMAVCEHSAPVYGCLCLVLGGPGEFAFIGWRHLEPEKYVLEATADFAGHFGDIGFAAAAVPML